MFGWFSFEIVLASRFSLETLLALRTFSEMRREDFDSDRSIEAGIGGFVDLSHTARADGLEDFEVAEAGAFIEGHDDRARS